MMSFFEVLAQPYFQKALFVLIFTGIAFPLIGVFIVTLKLIPFRFALMHVGLLGGALGLFLKVNPLITALILDAAFVMILGPASDKLKLDITGITGFFMVTTMALAFILFYKGNIHANDAFSVFWGSILSVNLVDIASAVILSLLIVASIFLLFKEIKAVLFNRELALSVGLPEKKLYYFFLVLTGLSIGYSMRIIGALLVDSVILLPSLTAFLIARDVKVLFLLSAGIGLFSNLTGLVASTVFDLPTGSTITIVAGLIFLLTLAIKHLLKRRQE